MAEAEATIAPEIVEEARSMNWVEKDKFRGDPAKWVDADIWVKNARVVLPIVKKENEDLRGRLTNANTEIAKLNTLITSAQESIAAMQELHTEETKRKVEQARKTLLAELKTAKADGDVDAEVRITDQLTEIRQAVVAEKKPDPVVTGPKDYTKEPDFVSWVAENPWFGTDEARTDLAQMAAARLRRRGETKVGKAFFDMIPGEMEKLKADLGGGESSRPAGDKVEGAGRSTARNGSKSFSDLPADAKAAAAKFESKLVGEGRAYKTQAEYHKYYAAKYFEE